MLHLPRRGRAGLPGAAAAAMRHGACRRRVDHPPATPRATGTSKAAWCRPTGIADRSIGMQAARSSASGCGVVLLKTPGGRVGGWRPGLCGREGICHQQRWSGQGRLHRAERRCAGRRGRHRTGRCPASTRRRSAMSNVMERPRPRRPHRGGGSDAGRSGKPPTRPDSAP